MHTLMQNIRAYKHMRTVAFTFLNMEIEISYLLNSYNKLLLIVQKSIRIPKQFYQGKFSFIKENLVTIKNRGLICFRTNVINLKRKHTGKA